MHLRYARPRIPVYLSKAKDIKDAFKVCPTPDPCLPVKGQRHKRFPGVPRTKSSILLTIRIHQIWRRVTGLPTTLDAFNAIPRRNSYYSYIIVVSKNSNYYVHIPCTQYTAMYVLLLFYYYYYYYYYY
jgi:hypothetical protein